MTLANELNLFTNEALWPLHVLTGCWLLFLFRPLCVRDVTQWLVCEAVVSGGPPLLHV